MSFIKSFLTISLVIGVVAVFLSSNFCKPYRTRLKELLPEQWGEPLGLESNSKGTSKGKLFSKNDLKKKKGENGGVIYLAILGQVFDVTRGKQHYGPGGGYHFFTGKDGTRAFVSGDFTDEGLREDISGFSLQEVKSIASWVEFYHKDYTYVGKLIGHYYDKNGNPTPALEDYKAKMEEAIEEYESQQDQYKKFPSCNSENKPGVFRRLWCSNLSGGIKRDWVGVPRQYFQPGLTKPRCACVRDTGPPTDASPNSKHKNVGDLENPNMKLYSGCDPKASSCTFNE